MGKRPWTPRPWLAAASRSSIVGRPVVGPQGKVIANVYAQDDEEANAALIAAAPDLYEALERLCEVFIGLDLEHSRLHSELTDGLPVDEDVERAESEKHPAMGAARAALTRADQSNKHNTNEG